MKYLRGKKDQIYGMPSKVPKLEYYWNSVRKSPTYSLYKDSWHASELEEFARKNWKISKTQNIKAPSWLQKTVESFYSCQRKCYKIRNSVPAMFCSWFCLLPSKLKISFMASILKRFVIRFGLCFSLVLFMCAHEFWNVFTVYYVLLMTLNCIQPWARSAFFQRSKWNENSNWLGVCQIH